MEELKEIAYYGMQFGKHGPSGENGYKTQIREDSCSTHYSH